MDSGQRSGGRGIFSVLVQRDCRQADVFSVRAEVNPAPRLVLRQSAVFSACAEVTPSGCGFQGSLSVLLRRPEVSHRDRVSVPPHHPCSLLRRRSSGDGRSPSRSPSVFSGSGGQPAGAFKPMLIGRSSPRRRRSTRTSSSASSYHPCLLHIGSSPHVRRSPDLLAFDHDGALVFSACAEISLYFYVGNGGRPVSSLQGGGQPAIPGISAFRCLSSPPAWRSPLPGGLIQ